MTINGIDASNNNGPVQWEQVAAAKYQFGIVKATEGTTFRDDYFAANWQAMQQYGLLRGAYHYALPAKNAATEEAMFFVRAVGDLLEPGDIVALDLESGSGNLAPWALTWLRTVEAALGFRPWLYSSVGFMSPRGLLAEPALAEFGLWLASWSSRPPVAPAPWDFWACWQNADAASVPGVTGPCDTDVFNGTREQWRAYGVPQPIRRQPTNDDLVYLIKFITAEPPDLAGLATALEPFQ